MANPRQRRKQKSGTAKVKQSRRQQDKLKKIHVQGPASLVNQWNPRRTAAQNYQSLGLAHKQPLALRKSGGAEKDLVPTIAMNALVDQQTASSSSDQDEDFENSTISDNQGTQVSNNQPRLSSHSRRRTIEKTLTSLDIPKGFARIERDSEGKVLRVIMSAHDKPEKFVNRSGDSVDKTTGSEDDDEKNDTAAIDEIESTETPWGRPLNTNRADKALSDRAKPLQAQNLAVQDLEARSLAKTVTKSTPRFASNAELDVLRCLVQKYGDDLSAMSRDIRLNKDQKTEGQLRKQLERVGGVERLLRT